MSKPAASARSGSATGGALRVVELFAGVGGFRLGLETRTHGRDFRVVWSNQWEPGKKPEHQWASQCYVSNFSRLSDRFQPEDHVCDDIANVLDKVDARELRIPDHDLLVGGFPCQDYSVAKPLNQAEGIRGKKGVLWWEIHRILSLKEPRFVLLENVDRLLKSPGRQRGRDFAIMLRCLAELGYRVEWRVVNAEDYGFPQRRRRVFLFGERIGRRLRTDASPLRRMTVDGVLARALPVVQENGVAEEPAPPPHIELSEDVYALCESFGVGQKVTPFKNAGVMTAGRVWTRDVQPMHLDPKAKLCSVLEPEERVPEGYFVAEHQLDRWEYLKGPKRERRVHKATGIEYEYSEGGLPLRDDIHRAARTILTGEGGSSPSRFKHLVQPNGRPRRLLPVELERLNGFPDGWTDTGMSDVMRAFCMGNALVVGIVERIGREIRRQASQGK